VLLRSSLCCWYVSAPVLVEQLKAMSLKKERERNTIAFRQRARETIVSVLIPVVPLDSA